MYSNGVSEVNLLEVESGLLEALKGHPADAESREFLIFFVGHSLGGAVAIKAAEARDQQNIKFNEPYTTYIYIYICTYQNM